MKKNKTVIFTGGGSGGHVIPALTLIEELRKQDYHVEYIGSHSGIEKDLVTKKNIPYHGIATGKLRRYLSLENLKDCLRIVKGMFDAFSLLGNYPSNTLVFATGGFVTVPVVIAARLRGFKIFIHEQTSRVGLANKICSFFSHAVFVTFEESIKFFPVKKTHFSGYPLRPECLTLEAKEVVLNGTKLTEVKKPILFVTGGGNGAMLLNDLVKKNLEVLKTKYFIIHQVGKRFYDEYSKLNSADYVVLDFVNQMVDVMKLSTVIISRAGAGTVCELMALNKKSIYIPLKIAQKNEQYHNAMEAHHKLGSVVVKEDDSASTNWVSLLDQFDPKPKALSKAHDGTRYLLEKIAKHFSD